MMVLKGKYLLAAAGWLTLSASPVLIAEETEDPGDWKVIRVTQGSEHEYRGHMLFTTDPEQTGAAFRCEKGRLYSYLSTRGVDFEALVENRHTNPKNREVTYQLGQSEAVEEIWVQMYRGHVYMAVELPTTLALFETAIDGGDVTFTRRYKDPFTVSLPGVDQDDYSSFLESCELKSKYKPHPAS